jgi:hypothetical protein
VVGKFVTITAKVPKSIFAKKKVLRRMVDVFLASKAMKQQAIGSCVLVIIFIVTCLLYFYLFTFMYLVCVSYCFSQ